MPENLPVYISIVFALTAFLTVGFLLYAVSQTSPTRTFLTGLAASLFVLLIVHAVLALIGFYHADTNPPRFPLGPVPTILILLGLFSAFARNSDNRSFLQILTLLHIIRVPVEIGLLWLYQNGLVPELMTFEGRNFDILSGLTAPFVAWLAFRGGKTNKLLLIVWNLAALGLLFNIVTIAILSLPTQFQQLGFEQPNRGVLYFPFIWLPSIIVPIVFVSHVISLRLLLGRKTGD